MARFFGSIQGARGEATRLGSASSGIAARAQGWNIGARVDCSVGRDGEDYCSVSLTTGSSGYGSDIYLGQASIGKDGSMQFSPSVELVRALGARRRAYVPAFIGKGN